MTQPGGFSPGVAARLRFTDGRRIFVKAVGLAQNPESPGIHRREIIIVASLPARAPAPQFLWSYDDGDWVALAFEDIDGSLPELPWRRDQLDRVLAMVAQLSETLTPTPVRASAIHETLELFGGWRTLADAGSTDVLQGLDPWARRHLDRLANLEERGPQAAEGNTLLHADIRADNILLTPGRVVLVDWPWASVGAAWIDLLCLLPSVAMQGGPDPWEIFDRHPVGLQAPSDQVTVVLAGIAGFFVERSLRPPPPNLPTLREFQAAQGKPALDWLRRRTGWS